MSAKLKPSPDEGYLGLSDRNAARFMRLPAREQMKFLHDLKFPGDEPQRNKIPFYRPALTAIRDVIRRGFPGIVEQRAKLDSIVNPARRSNQLRVLDAFVTSDYAKRKLVLMVCHRYGAAVRGLYLKFSPHVAATENGEVRYIYFNERAKQCDPEEARLTLEFAYWILSQNGQVIKPEQFEFIDLFTGTLYAGKEPRKETIQTLEELARLIESLWPTIEP